MRASVRNILLIAVVLAVLCPATSYSASSDWWNQDPAVKPGVPDYPWPDPMPQGAECAEVAAANVIGYWDANGYPDLVPDGTTSAQLIGQLAGYGENGDPKATLDKFFGDPAHPNRANKLRVHTLRGTWDNMITEMKKGEMVIVMFTSVDIGGHVVTLGGWDTDPKQIAISDPNSPVRTTDKGYDRTVGGNDFYNVNVSPTGGVTFHYRDTFYWASITDIVSVSPIVAPEPSSLVALSLGLVSLVAWRRRKRSES